MLPKVGIGINVIYDQKILLGIRKDNNNYSQPGGWLEYGESWEECGARELFEETGLIVDSSRMKHIQTFNCYNPETKYHNVAVYLSCILNEEESKLICNKEPEKCDGWIWVDFEFLIKNFDNLFFPIKVFLNNCKHIQSIDQLKQLI